MRILFLTAFLIIYGFSIVPAFADCTDPTAVTGEFIYNETQDVFQGCSLNGWVAFHAPQGSSGVQGCPNVGDVCNDGSIYAGLTPDGNVPFYAAAADAPGGYAYRWGQNAAYTWPGINQPGLQDCANVGPVYPEVADTGGGCQTGEYNTGILAAAADAGAPYQAALYCHDLTAHGHDDWYLPAINEMSAVYDELYLNGNKGLFPPGGPNGVVFWTSSERGAQHGWAYRVDRDEEGGTNKNDPSFAVRCFRKG